MTNKLRVTREAPGNYRISGPTHSYTVQAVESCYGDTQWVIDRDDAPAYGTADTLRQAKAFIAGYEGI